MIVSPNINTDYDCPSLFLNNDLQFAQNQVKKIWHDDNLPHDDFVNIDSFKKNEKLFETTYVLRNEEFNAKWIMLYDLFKNSYSSKANLFSETSFDTIENAFRFSMSNILKLAPEVITVGASEDGCLYIYAEFKQKKVFFNMFFEENESDIVLNISENGKPICSYSTNIERSIEALNNFIGKTVHEVDNYDLSRVFVTEV